MAITDKMKESLVRVYKHPLGAGMGFIVGSKTKYVITCAHCVPPPDGAGVIAWQKATSVQIKSFITNKDGYVWLTGYEPYLDCAILSCERLPNPLTPGTPKSDVEKKIQNTRKDLSLLAGIPLSLEAAPPPTVTLLTAENEELTAAPQATPCQKWSHDVWVNYELTDKKRGIKGGTSGTPVFDGMGKVWGLLNASFEKEPNIMVVNLNAVLPLWFPR